MKDRFPKAILVMVLLLVLQPPASGCGPFSMEAIFVFTAHPAYPLANFARGDIGVIQPSYARSYLYVAYRHLSNAPFTPAEQKALTELWNDRLHSGSYLGEDDWVNGWLEARKKVAGLPESPKISVYRNREKPNEYESFVNCTADSFNTAVVTLNERLNKYGADNAAVRTWVEAQDQVFANCSEGKQVPAELRVDDDLARADRKYQIAAANFYATNFYEARKAFEAISTDSKSPWRVIAPYLAARTLVRQASLEPADQKIALLTQAEGLLKKILADKQQTGSHAAANRMLDLVRFRLYPSDRMHELAHVLTTKTENPHLKQDLWDYTLLLDGALESEDQKKPLTMLQGDDLTDWISTLQTGSNESLEHSLARWQATHSSPWLIAVLSKIDGKHSRAAQIIAEALKIKSNSPAFASSRFHAVRLLMQAGKPNEARDLLDQLLKNNRSSFEASALNLLIGQRMMLATDIEDFLTHASRIPAALSWNDDGRETPSEPGDVSDESKSLIGKALFDEDATNVLNKQMPLSLLKQAALSESLPRHLRLDLTQAVWIRAILLDDFKTADELVPTLRKLSPALGKSLDEFAKLTLPEDKKFTGLYIWLKFPGIEPIVDTGIGRTSPLNQQDTYRDNWWCGSSFTQSTAPATEEETSAVAFTATNNGAPLFLTAAQKADGNRQWVALTKLGTMPNYLSKQAIQWATKNPADPRAAESLHLAVTSTRFGCTDKETGRWSKAAFDLLHRKYPNTAWAKKTKYWFKE
jgi:tetratricopeptide (TPR) repeat protein